MSFRKPGAVLHAYRTTFAECAIPFTEQELANWRGAHKLSLFHRIRDAPLPDGRGTEDRGRGP
jgi:hypothetical protein